MGTAKKIFIVEDNPLYAKQLSIYLTNKFNGKFDVKTFITSETCMMSLHENPHVIIMDHSLNTRFYDAEEGYNALVQIKKEHPSIKLILHSGAIGLLETDPNVCYKIPKGGNSLAEIERYLNQLA
jgi:DNA-binding NarL/FixJ family response regulator